ncbi:MAG: oligosaccharide flippase family protein [Nannocystaceae bacterium]|nr:oligosaccharide flippase family protein [Nannocystaceae bacterium]
MRRLLKLIPTRASTGKVAAVALGTGAGQGMVVLASPFVTRLYSATEFGTLAAFASLLGIALAAASLRYERAILLPKADADARALTGVSLYVAVCTGLATALVLWLASDTIAATLDSEELGRFLWTVPAALAAAAVTQVSVQWALRKEAYTVIGGARFAEGGAKALAQLGFGVAAFGTLGLLLAEVGASALGAAFLWIRLRLGSVVPGPMAPSVRAMMNRYWKFPVYTAPGSILNAAGLQLPTLLLATAYGLQVAGLYALGQRVVSAPLGLVGQAIGQVYVGRAADAVRNSPERVLGLYLRSTARLCLFAIPPAVGLGLFGPDLFAYVFGPQWRDSGVYVQIFAVAMVAQFTVVPVSQTLVLLERQELQLAWDVGRLVLVSLAVVGTAMRGLSPTTAIGFLAASMLLAYVVLWTITLVAIRRLADPASRDHDT